MPATVDILRWTGTTGAPTKSTITNINTRANSFDTHSTADTTSPVQIPVSGSNYSYWVSTRLTCSVTPAGTINNLRWYTDGANGFNGSGPAGSVPALAQEATSYVQATGTTGTTGIALNTTNHTGITGAPVDPFTFTVGSPKSLAGSISNPNTGDFGSWLVYQLQVNSNAIPGASPQETFTWKYDET